MKKVLFAALMIILVSLAACTKTPNDESDNGMEDYIPADGYEEYQTPDVGGGEASLGVWTEDVLASPLIAEVYNFDVLYNVYMYNTVKYIYNTQTQKLTSGTTDGDVRGIVLRDWISPHGEADLDPKDALFETAWANTGTRLRAMIGYCEKKYELVTRARTAEYVEYVYKDADEVYYRIAATDDYILYSPLTFMYIFDINAY